MATAGRYYEKGNPIDEEELEQRCKFILLEREWPEDLLGLRPLNTERRLQPDVGEYDDFYFTPGCQCDLIPESQIKLVKRHHFHYSRGPGLFSWSAVSVNALDELYDDVLGITDLNWTLANAYTTEALPPPPPFIPAGPTVRYTPRIFSFNDFSIRLQLLLVARENIQQVQHF